MATSLRTGQNQLTLHTLSLSPGSRSPPAAINDMAWFSGHWKGEALGGMSEEIWGAPMGGSMIGMYRLVRADKPVFYELMLITEENGSLVMRLKHFNPDLTGWEDKQKTVDFPLVAKADGAVYFEGMTFRPEGPSSVTIFLAIGDKEGDAKEEEFRYQRASPS